MKKRTGFYLMIPAAIFLTLFAIIPVFKICISTFQVEGALSIGVYTNILMDSFFQHVFIRTMKLSLISTIICAILGLPTAYYISKIGVKRRGLYIALAVFPMLTSPVVRSFCWIVILGKKGLLNTILLNLNLINSPLSMLYNEFSIVVGFVQLFLPLMILSLIGVMENITEDYMLAAESLGASKFKAFLKVVFPLSVPGLMTGSILVFTGCLTAYTTPQLLGGTKTRVLATLIYQNAMTLSDWNSASVVAVIMIITTIIVTSIMNRGAKALNKRG
ncbi:putative spermidine/putrescine transport system permease protein [Clostridium pascui]|uniref:ABC transporter permease n=1 Tax=Clostridium pascui TaxID=46609 RepID=UPI00195BFA55|nr:ABC transporter permease [Clostridium pascui]MBM7871189.1 putative spermidine/putrescine transport system permease protein [Clostridium pascui]